jgi:hypothetical protein
MLHKDYDRKGSVEKKIMVVGIKVLDGKKNWLAVNRQLWSNSDSDTGSDCIMTTYTKIHRPILQTMFTKLPTCYNVSKDNT